MELFLPIAMSLSTNTKRHWYSVYFLETQMCPINHKLLVYKVNYNQFSYPSVKILCFENEALCYAISPPTQPNVIRSCHELTAQTGRFRVATNFCVCHTNSSLTTITLGKVLLKLGGLKGQWVTFNKPGNIPKHFKSLTLSINDLFSPKLWPKFRGLRLGH